MVCGSNCGILGHSRLRLDIKHDFKVVILSPCLFIVCCCSHCLLGFSVRSLFCFAVLCVLSSFAIISLGKRKLVALLLLCSECHVAVIVL